jgi:thiamine biosynthesis lipoprotein
MSFVDEESEVSSVNRNAGIRPVTVSRDTFYVITKALEYAELTLGTFDITVGAVTALWGIGTGNARVPDSGEIEDMLPLVDYRFVKLDPEDRSVFLVKEGMKIDLGGIAKGYAADRAVEIMKEGGVERAILDFGGNIYVMGSKTEDTPWKVGVQNPEGTRGSYIGILEARETAVVSSGDYERFIEREGVRYHHIIDTETGYPVRNNISGCTIVADNSLKADALTTAVFSMGINEGLAFLAGIHRVGGLIVTDNREIALSADIKPAFTRTDSDFSIRESLRETERKESTQR